ncbi:MAG: hypothetical protein D6689_01100 [Deltaproteobacteria bacterium]|nr:MAG: hypothetical protein D6689_01100 [Deltaproteobacteria bacterium]
MTDKRDKRDGDAGRPPEVSTSARGDAVRPATFPPDRWATPYVSKTHPPATVPPVDRVPVAGAAPDDDDGPPTEAAARAFLSRRFAAAGYRLVSDYAFSAPGVAVVLDGYDPDQRVGFAYVSHADADVVSDIGPAEELAFKQMFDTRDAFVLVVHDRDIDQLSTLEHRLDDFLAAVHRVRSRGR